MKLTARIARSLRADMQAALRDIERAIATGTRDAGRGPRTELRRQVTSAGLGQRLANSWREERAEEGIRWQADQPRATPGASLRSAPVRTSAERTVAPGRGRLASLVQSQDRAATRLPACHRARPTQRTGSDHHGRDASAGAAGEAVEAARRRAGGRALVGATPDVIEQQLRRARLSRCWKHSGARCRRCRAPFPRCQETRPRDGC